MRLVRQWLLLIFLGEEGNWKLCKKRKRDWREKKGGGEGKRSPGKEVEEEHYDEYVCCMKCAKAIN